MKYNNELLDKISNLSLPSTSGLENIPLYKKGSKIHIKESHKGRLTNLKKRTGKTEAELYKDGSPEVRKMITFARNSRRWNKK